MISVFLPRVRSNLAVDAADILRDRLEWPGAVRYYQRALRICPARRPIWVQLGHALKECRQREEALTAYRRACALPGNDGNAPYCLGILALSMGHFAEAKAALQQAHRLMPEDAKASAEFLELLHDPLAVGMPARREAAALIEAEIARLDMAPPDVHTHMVFDASDLISYFRHSRLPTGIQRVQMEVIRAACELHPAAQIGCFSNLTSTWSRVPAAHFLTLCGLSVSGGDRMDAAWLEAIEILTAALAENTPVTFTRGSFLINLGTSWWLQNYFLHVRRVQQSFGIHYVPFVHDFIPVVTPEHCVRELTQDFLSWAFHVFSHADFFLVNSRSTRDDLHRVARILGHDVAASHVAVIPLDADFRRPELVEAELGQLVEWSLERGHFALFVSTIESRKNHRIAFQAWRELISRHGPDAVPDLVCVGNRGWLNDHVYAALDNDPILASKVRMLSQLSDEQLGLLYRQCTFTIYPSSYEGWGLPVTESLCYGKVPVLCRSSSLPEAGGDFALYFEPEDLVGLVAVVERLTFDPSARSLLELHIRDKFIPRTWCEVTQQIIENLGDFMKLSQSALKAAAIPTITFDRIYRLTRNRRTRLAFGVDEGEHLRSGGGWWEPEDWGCATRPEGGELAFALADGTKPVRCWLRLRGPLGRQSEVTIAFLDSALRFDLPEGAWRWVSFLVKPDQAKVRFAIHGNHHVDLSPETNFRDRRTIGIGLGGLVVTPVVEAQSSLLLAQTMTTRSSLSFLRDIHLLLLNREIDECELFDFLPLLESGEMSKADLISLLVRNLNYSQHSYQNVIFD